MQLLRDPSSWVNRAYRAGGKRLLDLAVAVPAAIVAAPVLLGVAAAVRASLGAPVLYRHERPGLAARPFELTKFRTMRATAGTDAERLTRVGAFLRRTSLDELPTLWNVLVGDMSLVGPRPLLMEYLPRYRPEHARRHEVKPGITGWAQVHGRHSTKFSERLARDVWYVDHVTVATDLAILAKTAWQVMTRRDVEDEQMGLLPVIDDVGLFYDADGRELDFKR
jgi:lipopolysaccharide/colanic/teichoic acid biosynthesis glycosyltransferase